MDNKAPPDSAGVVVRRIEKKVLSQPVEQLGITLGIDAEVVKIAPHSPAAAANIPVGFMIFDVNGDFVENEQQFNEAARKSINLIIKLQSTTGMSELIALVLEDDDRRSSGAINTSALNFDELLRSTPRFNFLSGEHPLFRRYNKRLSQQRQAAALIAQRTAEAEEQRQKEIKERMRRALEEEAALQKKREQEEAERQRLKAAQEPPRFVPEEPFLKIIKDESAFGQAEERKKPEAVPSPKIEPAAAIVPAEQPSSSAADAGGPAPKPLDEAPPLSAEELLSLVGIAPEAPETAPPPLEELAEAIALQPPSKTGIYITLPAEEYTLCSGERVVSVIKRRTGPIPPPPPGKPPVINKAAAQLFRAPPAAQAVVPSSLPKSKQHRDTAAGRGRQHRKRSRTPPPGRRDDRDDHRERSRRRRRDDDTPPPRRHRSSHDSRHRR